MRQLLKSKAFVCLAGLERICIIASVISLSICTEELVRERISIGHFQAMPM
jgi:ABC transporter substrate binding protein